MGDQLARVALAVLVFERTTSAALTALTYALTFLPPLVSAPLLTGLADRYPRRTIMVSVDLARAALVALMAVPIVPLPVVAVLLIAVAALQPLYSAARNAVLPNVLEGEKYAVGMGLTSVTDSLTQVAGFGLGGLLVGMVGPRTALSLDVATFLLSALVVRLAARPHLPIDGPAPAHRSVAFGAIVAIWRNPRWRSLTLLVWLYGFYIGPEGIAPAYADQLGAGSLAVGLLMASDPIGAAIGAFIFTRWVRADGRARLIGPLAFLAGIPLVLSSLHPWVPLAVVLWALSGVFSSHVLLASVEMTQSVPDNQRGQVIGLAAAGLYTAQGLGVMLAGALADVTSPTVAVALCGAAGSVCALWAGRAWRQARLAP